MSYQVYLVHAPGVEIHFPAANAEQGFPWLAGRALTDLINAVIEARRRLQLSTTLIKAQLIRLDASWTRTRARHRIVVSGHVYGVAVSLDRAPGSS